MVLLFGLNLPRPMSPMQDWFVVEDGERVLDVAGSFALTNPLTIGLKALVALYVTVSFFYTFFDAESKAFYFAFLSSWALVFSMPYVWISLTNSIVSVEQPRRLERLPKRVRYQFFMYNLALHASMLGTFLWWYMVFEKGVTTLTFGDLSLNTGTTFALVLEGFVVNRIPIRWYFWWGIGLPVSSAYLGWTYIHSLLNLGNPEDDQSGLIYSKVDWEAEPYETLAQSLIFCFAISPVTQGLLVFISKYGSPIPFGCNIRRYIQENTPKNAPAPSISETDCLDQMQEQVRREYP